MIFQEKLIEFLLDPLARLMEKVNDRIKDTIFVISCFGIFLLFWGRGSFILQVRYMITYILGCVCLGLMILCSLKPGIKPVKFRTLLAMPWFCIAVLMCCNGLFMKHDNFPEALLLLVAYPVVFIVWNNIDYTKIVRLLIRSTELSFLVYIPICILFFPMNTVKYSGLFVNVNGTGEYLSLVAACLLLEVLSSKKITLLFIARIFLLGLSCSLVYYTGSRTGLLALIAVFLLTCVVQFYNLRREKKRCFFRNLLLIAVSVVFSFNFAIYLFQSNKIVSLSLSQMYDTIMHSPTEKPLMEIPFTEITSTEISGNEVPDADLIRPSDSKVTTSDRFIIAGRNLYQITSGRNAIWREYLKKLNLIGHQDSGRIEFQYDGIDRVYTNSHMTILQIAYECGVIAGVLYLAYNLIAGVYAIWYAIIHKNNDCAMMPMLITAVFAFPSLLTCNYISFWYISTFFYYLMQFPLIVKKSANNENSGINEHDKRD